MSKAFVQSFFPSFTSFVSSPNLAPTFLVDAWNAIFPDDVGRLCAGAAPGAPPQDASVFRPTRPCLGAAATIGAVIGMTSRSVREKRRGRYRSGARGAFFGRYIHESWTTSLSAFGLMNVIALAHHCILPPHHRESYHDNAIGYRKAVDNFLWAADCILTGVSSTHLTIMALLIYRLYAEKENSGDDVTSLACSVSRMRMVVYTSLISSAASLSMMYQICQNERIDLWAAASTFTEMIYLVPLASATLSLLPLVIYSASKVRHVDNSVAGARIAILGGVVVFISLPLDASICYFVSYHAPSIKTSTLLYDIYHLPTLVFLGCDLSFWGLGMWLDSLMIHEFIVQNEKQF
jgi:hypothetical protein